jgi:hypothetical protein
MLLDPLPVTDQSSDDHLAFWPIAYFLMAINLIPGGMLISLTHKSLM